MYPITLNKVNIVRRAFCFKFQELSPTFPLCLWSCNVYCHTSAKDVLQLQEQKGTSNSQVTKRRKKQRPSCPLVLNHFDKQYSEELGDLWAPARTVLLDPHSWQYGVMLNRFSSAKDITQILQSQGFSSLLLQSDIPTLLSSGPSEVSSSAYEAGNKSLQQLHCIPECSPNNRTSPSLSQDFQCYIHPYPVRFPSQAHRPGHLKQYYLLNAASLLPVLALQVRDGEKVLDLCSAPGGKAIAIMQCATPELLCCNELDPHRRAWLSRTLESFLPHSLSTKVIVSAQDGRSFGQSESRVYDKVLVDAPCSNDRSWLYSSSSQKGEQQLKERARLPALQAQLLKSALLAVRPGGVVVYSTCTLSSAENYAVVETVLKDCPQAEPEDLWDEIAIPLSKYFTFRPAHPDHGQTLQKPSLQSHNGTVSCYHHRLGILVVPQPGKTWGPMFLSRIRRKK
ncbi:tRNA (cytosine(34)-C(5))-methyltransferase, mitochondrial [Halichoeres trimaculatus]|uniref:tRNA (cytosine(34)-C(5))-methyltransferase, mitochondrial n=1 Tax=Halichoeres trimaculatus TaxID=147232 RepID=UPI003D9F8C15